MNLIYADVKDIVASASNTCATSQVTTDVTNEAQERLLNKGDWANSIARYRACVSSGCLTWPRHVQRIVSWNNAGRPAKLRSMQWEFQEQGPGLVDGNNCNGGSSSGPVGGNCDGDMVDRDPSPVFEDLDTPSFLKLFSSEPETSKTIILQGYDETNNWIRTTVDGSLIDGEQVVVNNSQVQTVSKFSVVTNIIKDKTVGNVTLNQVNDSGVTLKMIGWYEPTETKPMYRRSFVPGLCNSGCETGTCDTRTVTVLVKLKHIDVSEDNDWLIVGNRAAFRLMATAIRYEKAERVQDAFVYEQKAIQELRDEYNNTFGDEAMHLQMDGHRTWGAGQLNMI